MSKSKHLKCPNAKPSIAVFPRLLRLLLRLLHKYPSILEFVRTGAQSQRWAYSHTCAKPSSGYVQNFKILTLKAVNIPL